MRTRPILLILLAAAGCGEPPRQPRGQSTPAPTPAPIAAPTSAQARADALIEDLRQREAAQAKRDRETPPAAPPALPTVLSAARPTPPEPASPVAAPPTPVAPTPATANASSSPARDATWWQQQRRSLQQVLDDASAQLAEAEKLNFKYGYNDAQAEYKKRAAAVAAARQAIDKLHDDARRAGVPPSWLR
jgi:hypothetical protein